MSFRITDLSRESVLTYTSVNLRLRYVFFYNSRVPYIRPGVVTEGVLFLFPLRRVKFKTGPKGYEDFYRSFISKDLFHFISRSL